MFYFILGFILGVVQSVMVVVILIYFRRTIEHTVGIMQKQIEIVGPRPKGFIVEPPSEADEARANIIAKNRAMGRDTPISELR